MNRALRYILENGQVNHRIMILSCKNIKEAHAYCKIHNVPGIIAGPAIENFIKKSLNMEKNLPSDCIGDINKNGINYEVKMSNGGKTHCKFNFVQIRFNHTCSYIFTAYHLSKNNIKRNGDLYIFLIDKNNLKYLVLKYGNYAHGSITNNGLITIESLKNSDKEYSLRPKFGDKCWKDMMKFRIYLKKYH